MIAIKDTVFCDNCVMPYNIKEIDADLGRAINFIEYEDRILCLDCYNILVAGNFPARDFFDQELNSFLSGQKSVLYAFSGGLDSTAVLFKLVKECQLREVGLQVFTILTGVKGEVARANVKEVIEFFGLAKRFFCVDIADREQAGEAVLEITGQPLTTKQVYEYCLKHNILPCGKICNSMIDQTYREIMEARDYSVLITGGDTPKKNSQGEYSLFWQKKSGITIFRGGYAFNLNKARNLEIVRKNNIPWRNPNCGGYDTDCLVPGVFFTETLKGKPDVSLQESIKTFPIILDYLAERTRFGIIDRQKAIAGLVNIEIASLATYFELREIFEALNESKKGDKK